MNETRPLRYVLNSDLSNGRDYPPLEQLGSDLKLEELTYDLHLKWSMIIFTTGKITYPVAFLFF